VLETYRRREVLPATFGMDAAGVRAEAERCRRELGFLEWEIFYRFALESVAA
jgi:hypothetical protein